MAENRLSYVDTAKFLAIYFVIISHCSMSSEIAHLLFSFHVPLFFILYGYVHKNMKINQSANSYLKKGGKALIYRVVIPYLLLSFILGDSISPKAIAAICFGSIQTLAIVTSTHLWFLPCYFISVLVYNMIEISLSRNKWYFILTIIAFAAFSAFFNYDKPFYFNLFKYTIHLTGGIKSTGHDLYIGMPLGFNVACSGMVLIYIGTLLRKMYDSQVMNSKSYLKFIFIIAFAILGFISYKLNDGSHRLLAMSMAIYGNYLLFLLTATSFSYVTILLSTYVNNSLFAKYGKYTFPIYAFHLSTVFLGNEMFKLLPNLISDNYELKGLIVGTITLIITSLLIPFIKKVDPNLIGEHK